MDNKWHSVKYRVAVCYPRFEYTVTGKYANIYCGVRCAVERRLVPDLDLALSYLVQKNE